MTNVLVVYGSAYGHTERIMRRIGACLSEHDCFVSLQRADALPPALRPEAFDAVVVAASVIVGKHQRCVYEFVSHHLEPLNATPSAFVSVCGAAGSQLPAKQVEARQYLESFLQRTAWRPRLTASFGGALAYTKYGFIMRWILKRIAKQSGAPTDTSQDHDLTDWNAVDRFALQLAAEFHSKAAV